MARVESMDVLAVDNIYQYYTSIHVEPNFFPLILKMKSRSRRSPLFVCPQSVPYDSHCSSPPTECEGRCPFGLATDAQLRERVDSRGEFRFTRRSVPRCTGVPGVSKRLRLRTTGRPRDERGESSGRAGIRTRWRTLATTRVRVVRITVPVHSALRASLHGRAGIRTRDREVRNLSPCPLGHTPGRKRLNYSCVSASVSVSVCVS